MTMFFQAVHVNLASKEHALALYKNGLLSDLSCFKDVNVLLTFQRLSTALPMVAGTSVTNYEAKRVLAEDEIPKTFSELDSRACVCKSVF